MTDNQTPADFWEARYSATEKTWSGQVNKILADSASELTPGTALDLGCGEGGDAVWLAEQGWMVVGIDLSPTAVERGRKAGRAHGLSEARLRFETGDLASWVTKERFDLVTSSFLQSWPVKIPREAILAKATSFVAPGGHFLVTAHATAPSWADPEIAREHEFPTPESDLEALSLSPNGWEVIACELREREITSPEGQVGTLSDSVVFVKRTK